MGRSFFAQYKIELVGDEAHIVPQDAPLTGKMQNQLVSKQAGFTVMFSW